MVDYIDITMVHLGYASFGFITGRSIYYLYEKWQEYKFWRLKKRDLKLFDKYKTINRMYQPLDVDKIVGRMKKTAKEIREDPAKREEFRAKLSEAGIISQKGDVDV